WEQAVANRRLVENKFSASTKPVGDVRIQNDSRKTLEQAVELFLSDKRNEGVNEQVVKKYERELGRLQQFLAQRSKFFPSEIAPEDLTEFRAGWEQLYPSTHTRSRVLTRLRAFLRYCFDRAWIDRIPKIASIKIEECPTLPFTDAEYK